VDAGGPANPNLAAQWAAYRKGTVAKKSIPSPELTEQQGTGAKKKGGERVLKQAGPARPKRRGKTFSALSRKKAEQKPRRLPSLPRSINAHPPRSNPTARGSKGRPLAAGKMTRNQPISKKGKKDDAYKTLRRGKNRGLKGRGAESLNMGKRDELPPLNGAPSFSTCQKNWGGYLKKNACPQPGMTGNLPRMGPRAERKSRSKKRKRTKKLDGKPVRLIEHHPTHRR